jgi:hypothetical protein
VATISGAWTGRLVDAGGFEGRLTLRLEEQKGGIRGTFTTAIRTQHGEMTHAGGVDGTLKGDHVTLRFELKEVDAKVELTGELFEMHAGGFGLKGCYEVAARRYSPLIAGVVVAQHSRSVPLKSVRAPVTRTTPAKPDQPKRATAAKKVAKAGRRSS